MIQEPIESVSTQFSLRSLLVLMSAAAVLTAIGVKAGRDWAWVLIGVFVVLANYLGMLAVVQRPRLARIALYVACALWAVSFFLPTYQDSMTFMGVPGTPQRTRPLPGWRACLQSGYEIPRHMWGIVSSRPLKAKDILIAIHFVPLILAATIGNLALAALPFMVGRLVAGKASWFVTVLAICCVGVWLAPFIGLSLFSGYFFWCSALTVPMVFVRLRRGTLFALLITVSLVGCAFILAANDW